MTSKKAFNDTIDQIQNTLKAAAGVGWQGLDCSDKIVDRVERWGAVDRELSESLNQIRADLGDCARCRLSEKRRNIVFGEGSGQARLVFVGEGPGYDEDVQGSPFVGAAGKLLTKIIQAMKLEREQVYICNVIKCRPPGNRNPHPNEIAACLPFLKRQIAAVAPAIVCALGTFAAQTLLDTREPISRLRGRFHPYEDGIQIMPTYHPAYLLRNAGKKKEVWSDVQKIMKAMGIEKDG